jgi:hypothetical protein
MGGLDDAKEIVRLQEQVKSINKEIEEMKADAKVASGRMWFVGMGVITAIVMQVLKTAGVIQ